MAEFDPYHIWLGIRPEEQPPNHYRLLAISHFEADPDVISHAADQRMAHLRTFQAGTYSALSQRLLNEVAAARICLLHPERKATYDQALCAHLESAAGRDEVERLDEDFAQILSVSGKTHPKAPAPNQEHITWTAQTTAWIVTGATGAAVGLLLLGGAIWNSGGPWTRPTASRAKAPAVKKDVVAAPNKAVPPVTQHEPSQMETAARGADEAEIANRPTSAPSKTPMPASAVLLGGKAPKVTPVTAPAPPGDRRADKPSPPALKSQSPQSPPVAPVSLLPVPDEASLVTARRLAEDLYREEYDKAIGGEARGALAKKILQDAGSEKLDGSGRYALLALAAKIAGAAGNRELALQAIDETAKAFSIDVWESKADILRGFARRAQTVEQRRAVVDDLLRVAEAAMDDGSTDAAGEMLKAAQGEVGKLRDKALGQRLRELRKDLEVAERAAEELKAGRETLKQNPTDPVANTAVGRHLCFAKGNWEEGLSRFAAGNDQRLRELASLELELQAAPGHRAGAKPTSAEEPQGAKLKIADGWWEMAQAERGRAQDNLIIHAGTWYRRAIEEADTPLARARLEKRISAAVQAGRKGGKPLPAVAPFDAATAKRHQEAWARYLGTQVEIVNSIGMRFVLIPPGEFEMGATAEEQSQTLAEGKKDPPWLYALLPAELPRHRVRLTKPIFMGAFEVMQKEYLQVTGTNPSSFSAAGSSKPTDGSDTMCRPVEMITWEEAKDFCVRLSALAKERTAARKYRLPTEAEWEYACRAGTVSRWYSGDDESRLLEAAWVNVNSNGHTHPAGEKQANPFRLYDMHGNVWEWCLDYFDPNYYGKSPASDPRGPDRGLVPVNRGGSWRYPSRLSRSAFRQYVNARNGKHAFVGMRVCLEQSLD